MESQWAIFNGDESTKNIIQILSGRCVFPELNRRNGPMWLNLKMRLWDE